MLQDIRFGARIFFKSPGITALILITLALGIGANTTIFSVINSVLLRPLPYKNPDRIVQVSDVFPGNGGYITSSFPKYTFIREHARRFDSFSAVTFGRFQISGPGPAAAPAEVQGVHVSVDFFRALGAAPFAGRTFVDDEERPGGNSVAIISYAFWQNRFGSDPTTIGKTLSVDGSPTTIVGIMPAGFDFPSGTEIWEPRIFEHAVITPVQIQRGASYLLYFARLADGVDIRAAQAEMSLLGGQYDESHKGYGDAGREMIVMPLRESLVRDIRRTLLVLLGAVGLVLLIAAANVANLLLARAIARQKEVAIRASLGASRSRLLVQFLTESVLLSTMGAALGLLLTLWSMRLIAHIGPDLPRADEIHVDATVLFFTMAIAFLTGILFGLGPAMHSSRLDLNEALKATSRGVASGRTLRGVIIVSEVALAMILLTGAGLLLRSFLKLESVDPGFRPQNLLTMRIGLPGARYSQPSQRAAFFDRVLERAAAIPGVRDVAVANALPVNGRSIGYFFNVEGSPALDPAKAPTFWLHSISPTYFQTMTIPLIRGRAFTAADTAASHPVGVINEAMARRFWPKRDPIGQHVTYARESITVEIVGVAADVKIGGLGDDSSYNLMYVPYRQRPFLTMWLITRGPTSIASAARRAVLSIDADQPVGAVETMEQRIADSVSEPRLRTALIGAFAALALILAVIGIAGVVAWSVSQRTNEIGIRMALGARGSNILGMLVRQSFTLIAAGELIGLAGAFAVTRVLSNFLFGISPEDPATFGGVVILLGLVAVGACALAARRALRIDPMAALRRE